MKKIFSVIALLSVLTLNAQNKYESAMLNGFAKLKETKGADDLQALGA